MLLAPQEQKMHKNPRKNAGDGAAGKRPRFCENLQHSGTVWPLFGTPDEIAKSERYFQGVLKGALTLVRNSRLRQKGANGAGVEPFFRASKKRGSRRRLAAVFARKAETAESDAQFFSSQKKGRVADK